MIVTGPGVFTRLELIEFSISTDFLGDWCAAPDSTPRDPNQHFLTAVECDLLMTVESGGP